ncbi:MAG: chromophore lyase CpcT/CpeT [Hyphomonadaceae bacterium]|nr:chromophore lyase CpcT/CpeT [Hyphomonadaceae bacterium]
MTGLGSAAHPCRIGRARWCGTEVALSSIVVTVLLSVLATTSSLAQTPPPRPDPAPVSMAIAESFAAQMAGSWTSAVQSAHPVYDWVESEVVRIWPERTDGIWLYQENAILGPDAAAPSEPGSKDRPYFQVVIQVQPLDAHTIYTTTWRVLDRAGARGGWRNPAGFQRAWMGDPSCPGVMRQVASGYWEGGAECPNSWRGATRVLSRSVRTPDTYVNWDRGLDGAGNHVWGPRDGGYVFTRKGAGS